MHSKQAYQLPLAILIIEIFLVLYATLFPFDFLVEDNYSISEIARRFEFNPTNSYYLWDIAGNILLFIPFGFGLGGLLHRRGIKGIWALVITILFGLCLSVIVEIVQASTLSRFSDISDLITNTSGAALGFIAFRLFGERIFTVSTVGWDRVIGALSIWGIGVIYLGWILLMVLVTFSLQNSVGLHNWDLSYPLIVGNESSGDRPWQGQISEIYLADRALTRKEITEVYHSGISDEVMGQSLVASYQFTDAARGKGITTLQPDLVWQGSSPQISENDGALFTSGHWLQTEMPVADISQGLANSSQFTLGVKLASVNPNQSGPARIVSISIDPYHRNLTLGQEGDDLVFRLRTPSTGVNGKNPEFVIPDVFINPIDQHLIVTFDKNELVFYIDGTSQMYTFEFTPETMLFWVLPPTELGMLRLNTISNTVFRFLYMAVFFVPLGFLLSLVIKHIKVRSVSKSLLVFIGVLIPPLTLLAVNYFYQGANRLTIDYLNWSGSLLMFTVLLYQIWISGQLCRIRIVSK